MSDGVRCERAEAAASLADEISGLERRFISDSGVEAAAVEEFTTRIRPSSEYALIGRALCLLSRVQILHGRHEVALATAKDGLGAFAKLDAAAARRCAAWLAELLRAEGAALCKLGRLADALAKLEEAVRVAQGAVDEHVIPPWPPGPLTAQSALLRSLVTLGVALYAVREIDTAIAVYARALDVSRTHPDLYEYFFDDAMLARSNLTDALHERIRRRRAAGEFDLAAADIAAARRLLDAQEWRFAEDVDGAPTLSRFGRTAYYSALGNHLLITGDVTGALAMFERELEVAQNIDFPFDGGLADAHASIAQAQLELHAPGDALEHCGLALAALDRHDESNTRAAVLLVRAQAYHALGRHAEAYAALTQHHALRARLEALAAQQYARHMTGQLGLERARADAESHQRVAAMLATLGQIGQEITANLDAAAIFTIVARHVAALLHPSAFTIWFLDDAGERLTLAFGVEDGRSIAAADIFVADTRSPAARCVRERREVLGGAGLPGARMARILDGTRPMRTAFFVPLIVADRMLGAVSIQSENADAYTENERSIFRTLSTYAAIALDNAAAYTKIERNVVALQATQSALARKTAEFERLSMTDALTGVANRRHLDERARAEIATMQRKRTHLAVVMFDIDHFKQVNDNYGHGVGDVVLRRIAQVAKDWLRPADLIARIGGEEFALLLPGVGLPEAIAIAERIRVSIAGTTIVSGAATVMVTTSFGVATFDDAHTTLDPVMSRADTALYSAKQAGRDRVHAAPGT